MGRPVCVHCQAPYRRGQNYCDRCGRAVGPYTDKIPFVHLRENLRLWSGKGGSAPAMVLATAVVAVICVLVLRDPSYWPLLILPFGIALIVYLGVRSHGRNRD